MVWQLSIEKLPIMDYNAIVANRCQSLPIVVDPATLRKALADHLRRLAVSVAAADSMAFSSFISMRVTKSALPYPPVRVLQRLMFLFELSNRPWPLFTI